MKTLFTVLLCVILSSNAFTQIEKVILKYSQTQPRWVLTCDNDVDENCTLAVYFPDGSTKATAKVIYHDTRNRFRPNGDAIVYDTNGKIHQQYDHSTGTLLTFYPTGELQAKMITPIDGDMEYKYVYYKSGQLWEEEVSKHKPGQQSLAFGYSQQRDYFYDNQGYSYNFYKTFHSNGKTQISCFY